MARGMLCYVVPLEEAGGVPTPPIYFPPGIWPPPGYPAHPIAPGGGGGTGIWGGAPLPWPTPPIAPGGPPPVIWPGPGYPAHPIAPGGPPPSVWPPGIWGGGNVPMPTPPIFLPPGSIPGLKPEHPIYVPPSVGVPGFPTHPIVLPPPGSDEKPEVLENWDVKTAWSPQTGWLVAVVPSEQHPGVPTPSKA